jgi:pyridoxamine 5'-phosphate oxidase
MNSTAIYREAIQHCRELLDRAQAVNLDEPIDFSLATVDADGQPSVRVLLLRGFDERGFVFYTNSQSRKGRELDCNPRAALCFYWDALREQLRVQGKVERVSD